jgi:uncharacterized protein YrzB (UPF0473 family)
MAEDNTPSKQGNRRRFDELVAMRSVFGNDEVLLEEIIRNMSNRDASYIFKKNFIVPKYTTHSYKFIESTSITLFRGGVIFSHFILG